MFVGGTYGANVSCQNCAYEGFVSFPRGTSIQRHPCPYCGTRSLEVAMIDLDKPKLNTLGIRKHYETKPPEALKRAVEEDIEPCP